jgi:hypothetical protein
MGALNAMAPSAVSGVIRAGWLLLTACVAVGCSDLDDFRTGPDEVFRGRVAGSETGNEATSFIRSGFPSYTEMALTFDPDRVDTEPGTISTVDTVRDRPSHFRKTKLEPIEPLAHDPLTEYTFPGGGRIRNYLFGARLHDQPRSALVFVSLMEDGDIEVRVIAPATTLDNGETLDELFGVFRLELEQYK